jgi:predicted transcriptional regulator
MLNRQRDEIIRDILTTAMGNSDGSGISMIMFRAFLSHSQAKAYLSELVDKGLVENTNTGLGKNFYRTSPKGVEYLAALSNITQMIGVESMRRTSVPSF